MALSQPIPDTMDGGSNSFTLFGLRFQDAE
jgi:hypothetical protein